jgi:hypothetical protein
MSSLHSRQYGLLAIVGMSFLLVGCASKGRNLPLDKTLARESLIVFLDTWKNKQSAKLLKDRTPSIVGLDDDWDAGKKLESYEIVNMDRNDGSNVYAVVNLNFANADGAGKSRRVTYIIGTSPVVSIFRD